MQESTSLLKGLFHRRFTVVEGFGKKSALIEIHLSSIDMLVPVSSSVYEIIPVHYDMI